jgi:hypothetical protein
MTPRQVVEEWVRRFDSGDAHRLPARLLEQAIVS